MKIWVDADACPKVIKDMLFRVAERRQISVTLIANTWFRVPESPFINCVAVGQGPDVADDEIVRRCEAGDLVVTADIPLAARVVEKGGSALDPRGTLYDENNVKQILAMRDLMDSLRGSGVETGGPAGFGQKERNLFANELDRFVAKG